MHGECVRFLFIGCFGIQYRCLLYEYKDLRVVFG